VVNENEKQLQKDKVGHFFRMARQMLEKHFDLWVNEYLFLAIYGEPETSQVVAQFLLEKNATGYATNGMHESQMHGRIISLPKLREFLQSRTTTNRHVLRTSLHFLSIHQEVIEIANAGGNMWQERNCPLRLSRLQTRYRECYSAVATNSHLAERGVKSANFCSVDGRSERLESAYGTARAGLVEPIHLQTRLAHEEQDNRSGNQYVLSGSVNERKRKDGNEFQNDEQRVRNVTGAIHAEHAIKFVTHRTNTIREACKASEDSKQQWDRLCQGVSEKENHFSVERVRVKTDDFAEKYDLSRAPNVIQRRRGVETTPFMLNKVPFGKLLKDRDWVNLKIELAHRDLSIEGKWTECKERLMRHEGDKKNFKIHSNATFPWYAPR
jgi:hypothetical protein